MARWRRRLLALGLGLICALLVLEGGLRLAGAIFTWNQRRANLAAAEASGLHVVLCLGESTTALGGEDSWPAQLEELLNEGSEEPRFAVVNAGVPGADTTILLARVEAALDRYRPQTVVAMMGANDGGGAVAPEILRDGFPHNLKVVRLAAQLRFDLRSRDETTAAGQSAAPAQATGGELPAPVHRAARRYEQLDGTTAEDLGQLARLAVAQPSAERFLKLARLLEENQQHDAAAAWFARAAEAAPDSPEGCFGLGRLLSKEGRLAAAASHFEEALRRDPHHGEAATSLGLCYAQLGRQAEAEQMLLRGAALRPGQARAINRVLDFYAERDLPSKAEAFIGDLGEAGKEPAVAGRIGRYFAQRGEGAQALKWFSWLLERQEGGWSGDTRANYHELHALARERGIRLIAMQYPTRSVSALRAMLGELTDVEVVDNAGVFQPELDRRPYEELFWDHCYGDFGHATRLGNRLIARNVAAAILGRLPAEEAPAAPAIGPEEMVEIPGGSVAVGALSDDREARPCERPQRELTVPSFRLDRTEVTVADWAEAVGAGVVPPPICRIERQDEAAICNWYFREERADHPVNGVNWLMAEAYCRWRGKRLPTEVEFEYVLRNGHPASLYPWGDSYPPPSGFGNFVDADYPPHMADGPLPVGYRDGHIFTAPAAAFPPDSFGLHDIAGNTWEWVANTFTQVPGEGSLTPPPPTSREVRKILRGGGFHCIREELRCSERHDKRALDGSVYSGFRCAADLPVG